MHIPDFTASFPDLTAAEQALIQWLEAGSEGLCAYAAGEFPEKVDQGAQVRAGLIRAFLAMENGPDLRLRGMRIVGGLDLRGLRIAAELSLTNCHVTDPIEATNARFGGCYISGCHLAGINADNARFEGAFYIRRGSAIAGEVSLAGAHIGGDFQLCDVEITSPVRDAVFAPSLTVSGSLYLGNYPYADGDTYLKCDGALFLANAEIGHDLFLTQCAIAPKPETGPDTVFAGSEEHGPDIALSLARARIGGILYLRDNQIARGVVNLAGAHATRFRDEPAGPGASYPIRLDGFTYDDFSRHAETDLKARLEWLARRPRDADFTAQPYEHLARVLAHMGHRDDARAVRMRKERILRQEERKARAENGKGLQWWATWASDNFFWITVGYGFRPGRALVAAFVLLIGLGIFFQAAWRAGDMTPNAAPILVSPDWIAATQSHPENPAAHWTAKGQAGQDWETFNGYAYAADLVIPLVSLGQEEAWAPSTSRSALGRVGWWVRWIAKGLGWIITALGAAALTGLVRQD